MSAVRIMLVEDHWLVRASLRSLLEALPNLQVVGEASDGREALARIAILQPDLVLMDISMAGLNGHETTEQILKSHAGLKVIVVSMHAGEEHVFKALRAGASGYVFKGSSPFELELAITAVMRGELFLSSAISRHVIDAFLSQRPDHQTTSHHLTPKQREILQLVAEGKSSKEIAGMLGSSVKTVESHRSSLMARLDIHEVAGLVRYAIRNGLVSSDP